MLAFDHLHPVWQPVDDESQYGAPHAQGLKFIDEDFVIHNVKRLREIEEQKVVIAPRLQGV